MTFHHWFMQDSGFKEQCGKRVGSVCCWGIEGEGRLPSPPPFPPFGTFLVFLSSLTAGQTFFHCHSHPSQTPFTIIRCYQSGCTFYEHKLCGWVCVRVQHAGAERWLASWNLTEYEKQICAAFWLYRTLHLTKQEKFQTTKIHLTFL